jgi:hypothetical protein
MRTRHLWLAAFSFFAGAAVSGCAANTGGPIRPDFVSPQTQSIAAITMRDDSRQSLLYVSSTDGNVYVYAYPEGDRQGMLTGFTGPSGECVDSVGDVFVVALAGPASASSTIYEYAHGENTPIAVLGDPGHASGCSIDVRSGNLAVANVYDSSSPYNSENGSVAIYRLAQGTPTLYYPREFGILSCGYDNRGDLYLAVSSSQVHVAQLARLTKGDSSIKLLHVGASIYGYSDFQPSVQWDGHFMTVTSNKGFGTPVSLYRLSISGRKAKIVGTTVFRSQKDHHGGQSWIGGRRMVGISYLKGSGGIAVWRYPTGGDPTSQIKRIVEGSQGLLSGVVISTASPR